MRSKSASNSKEGPHLSGAYIRSLVKHLSSSRPKDHAVNPKSPNSTLEDRLDETQPPPPPPHQPKKQVRRRLHTSRPYQERLLNMAEARREIVTALKFHRAAMKQANEQQQQQQERQPSPPPPPPPPPPLPHVEDSRVNPKPNLYQQSDPTFLNPTFSPFTYPTLPWSYPTLAPLPDIPENINFPLPNQPLGLNLNLQGFNNIDRPSYNSQPSIDLLSPHSSSSSSYSYLSAPTISTMEVVEAQGVTLGASNTEAEKLHLALGEEEMAEIRMIGEKHDIEWNDTMNLVTTAWWSKLLDTVEVNSMEGKGKLHEFDEGSSIPDWLKDGSGGVDVNANHLVMANYVDDYYLHDASLPCLDIGEIEGFDGEWLS